MFDTLILIEVVDFTDIGRGLVLSAPSGLTKYPAAHGLSHSSWPRTSEPDRELQNDLDALEEEDPQVRAMRLRLSAAVESIQADSYEGWRRRMRDTIWNSR